jgi:tubulin polyglutamylase TTLL4
MIKSSGTIIDISRKQKKIRKIPMSVRKPVSQYVAFLKSPFKGRGPVMFFPYPSYVGEEKEDYGRLFYRHQADIDQYVMRFKISETTNIYNAVVNSCKAAGMLLVNEKYMLKKKNKDQGLDSSESSDEEDYKDEFEDDYNILFTGAVKEDILRKSRSYYKISHFPHSYNIGRKDAMWRNINRMYEMFPEEYDFCPRTYVFPNDADDFEAARLKVKDYSSLWIFKPSASSCGKGISIMTKDTPIPENKRGFVICDYIANPHLIDGLKYDLRIYVLVTSFDPLVCYMYDDGLARFATGKFTLDESKFEDMLVHLTNYSIQKKSEAYTQNNSKDNTNLRASKWSLKTLQKVFEDHGKDFKGVKQRMFDLMIKTLISVEGPINKPMRTSKHKDICFELYGFDIIIDSDLKPWILEVNISPSFSSSSPFDKNLKTKLI